MNQKIFLLLLLSSFVGFLGAADKTNAKPDAPSAQNPKATNAQVIAYYFHGTMRCVTCQKIEQQARAAIERKFTAEVAEKRLVFESANYDLAENAHFLKDYKLPCPSLVIVRSKGSKDEKWKLLGETWDHIENPKKFNDYIEREVGIFMRNPK